MDESGEFFGAVGPGEASLLVVPSRARTILAVSSVGITAGTGTWFTLDEIAVPAPPDGLLLQTRRNNARQCGSGNYADASIAAKTQLEATLAEADVVWLKPRPREGQAWLEAHRARLDELLGRKRAPQPAVVHRVHVP